MIRFRIANLPQAKRELTRIVNSRKTFAVADVSRLMVQRSFNSVKTKMIADFLNHPVTQELYGPSPETATNISGTLNYYGNLFSFIGFTKGEDPITPILNMLQGTDIKYLGPTSREIKFQVIMPAAEDIFHPEVTPLPWAKGRSWAKGIEQGISGLGWYLYKASGIEKSESGTAIQTKYGRQSQKRPGLTPVRRLNSDRSINAKFNNIPYISSFLNKWANEFANLSI